MSGKTSRRLAALVIVTVASGCDNVEWGGVDVRLQPPPPASVGVVEDTVAEAEESREALLPTGPVLYMGRRDSTGLRLVPVGEILADSMAPFLSEQAAPGYRARFARELIPEGKEFVLFAEGARVGSFTALTVETDTTFCAPRPVVRGVTELIPEALTQERFLALPREHARGHGWRAFEPMDTEFQQREASLAVAADIIQQVGAEFPGNILNTRWDLQAFRPGASSPPAFAVTYLLRDRLRIERPVPTAYSLFILGMPEGGGYQAGYVWYREVAREGKGAPMFFEQFDWDGDGQAEILLEVLGERRRWTAALDRKGGRWTRVYEDPCGAAAPPVGGPS